MPVSYPVNDMKLKVVKEPVTRVACESRAPEPLGRLIWCYKDSVAGELI